MTPAMVKKYRKKPVVVEAIEFDGTNGLSINQWTDGKAIESPVLEPTEDNPIGAYLQINTLEGTMIAKLGDYIIKGVNGEFYPCKPAIFKQTYELIVD